MKTRITDAKVLSAVLVILVLFITAGCANNSYTPTECGDDSGTPTECDKPPLSVLSVDVTDFQIHVEWMLPGPDYLVCRVTLRIENLSSEYSYSDVSIPSARVYRAMDNQLLGEIRFETDWDGSLDASEVVTVEFEKIEEDSKIFEEPCNEYLYLDITITSPGYGEMNKATPTDICSCLI